ncbi:hypothetical protein BG261_05335 [Floricoccus tropicus]|uniref:Siphovirus-type tail component RIFT-related domain-containing protein n=1 Tax=Floricoccus tropicus TaxID=1859473 RepID=A0A1E8GMF0_9LACT|nr:phage tail domain-containing protein [Floricoccus tropicus]OFI48813.1 hypothetical protein BG261_05335 [Floricoccus tropicus]
MVLIKKLNGKTYDLDDADIRTVDLVISSPNMRHNYEHIDGSLGMIDFGSDIESRNINATFRARASQIPVFSLLRDEIFEIFSSEEPFYLIEKRLPGKQWLVKVDSEFSLQQKLIYSTFEIEFIAIRGISESVLTTQQLQLKKISAFDNSWAWGMGLETVDDTELIYTHNAESTATFKVFNAGNVDVHPFEAMLNIAIKNVVGSTARFKLKNITTDSKITINKPVTNTDVWRYEGANVTRNKLAALKDTAKDFIFLKPGWNTFQIYDCKSATIEFDFKFIYR